MRGRERAGCREWGTGWVEGGRERLTHILNWDRESVSQLNGEREGEGERERESQRESQREREREREADK